MTEKGLVSFVGCMNNSNFFEYYACPACLGGLSLQDEGLFCGICKKKFRIAFGKAFFIEPPENAPQDLNADPANQAKWSNWRKANYRYSEEKLAAFPSGARIVDLGAGPSQFRNILSRFSDVISVDFFPYEKVNVIADITARLPLQNGIADAVILSNVLEHTPNPAFVLSECFRILKPGGAIIGTIPFLMRVHQAPYDFNRFTNFMLERLLRDAGFRDIAIKNLAKTVDLYQNIQIQFFYYLLSTKFSENAVAQFFLRLLARIAWRLTKYTALLFLPLYKQAMDSPEYTQGYGFFAKK